MWKKQEKTLKKCDKLPLFFLQKCDIILIRDDNMKRFITEKLINWKNSTTRKPLILKWARQVGKTYILKEFGKKYYDDVAYFNFDHDNGLSELFTNTKDPKRIIEQLILVAGKK